MCENRLFLYYICWKKGGSGVGSVARNLKKWKHKWSSPEIWLVKMALNLSPWFKVKSYYTIFCVWVYVCVCVFVRGRVYLCVYDRFGINKHTHTAYMYTRQKLSKRKVLEISLSYKTINSTKKKTCFKKFSKM